MTTVQIKHLTTLHSLTLPSPPSTLLDLKSLIYSLTSIPPASQKLIIKAVSPLLLKSDSTPLSSLNLKQNQLILVIGPAGPPVQRSEKEKEVVFREDLDDGSEKLGEVEPKGLKNEGNTCYLNSAVQVLVRSVDGLGRQLDSFTPPTNQTSFAATQSAPSLSVTLALKDLYKSLKTGTGSFFPTRFIQALRVLNPQFSERSRANPQLYAQQDSQECWSTILQALINSNLGPSSSSPTNPWIKQHFGIITERTQTLKAEEKATFAGEGEAEEEATVVRDDALELKCSIGSGTNYLGQALEETMSVEIEKHSPLLGRNATYTEVSKIARLPEYLTLSLTRFYWRREISKKAKILRRIKFPFDLDLADHCTPSLRSSILPLSEKVRLVEKERRERGKVLSKVKKVKVAPTTGAMEVDGDPPEVEAGVEEDPEEVEKKLRSEEKKEMEGLVAEGLKGEEGVNPSGVYELVGVVTHKGAYADGGHYIAFTRIEPAKGSPADLDPDKEQWWKFDDEKVSIVGREKITALEGGGEDHSAYILLYKSKSLE